jgi:recombination protein RecT
MTSEDTGITKKPRYDTIIDEVAEDFKSVAPSTIQFKAERSYALQLLQNNDYLMRVAESNPISLAQAIKNVAAIGLSLNPAKKQAYLIPRSIKFNGQFINKVFLEPSYMGMCDLATGLGTIAWIQARCVYDEDKFIDNGPGQLPTHTYDAFAKQQKRGEFVGAYCVAKTKDGDFLTTTMNAEAILLVRKKSEQWKKSQSGPWKDHFEEQAKKTVVRNAFKMWPKGEHMERLEQAIHISNENEGFEPLVTSPETRSFTAEQKKYFDKLISNGDDIEMFCFMGQLDHGIQSNLYNSFEKGSITKYKNIVSGLIAEGQRKITDITVVIEDAVKSNDEFAIKELIPDLSQEAIDYLLMNTSDEAGKLLSECRKEEEE